MGNSADENTVAAMSFVEQLRVTDLESFLHVFQTFDWEPRISLPGKIVGDVLLTFATSDGTVLQITKDRKETYTVKFGFEDPDDSEGHRVVKRDQVDSSGVESLIKVFYSDSIDDKRAWLESVN